MDSLRVTDVCVPLQGRKEGWRREKNTLPGLSVTEPQVLSVRVGTS